MKAVFRVFGEVACYFGESEEERHHRMVRLLATRFFLCSLPAQAHMLESVIFLLLHGHDGTVILVRFASMIQATRAAEIRRGSTVSLVDDYTDITY